MVFIIITFRKFSTEDKCDYIISTDKNDFKVSCNFISTYFTTLIIIIFFFFFQLKHSVVSPQWIWDCYDAKKILPLK